MRTVKTYYFFYQLSTNQSTSQSPQELQSHSVSLIEEIIIRQLIPLFLFCTFHMYFLLSILTKLRTHIECHELKQHEKRYFIWKTCHRSSFSQQNFDFFTTCFVSQLNLNGLETNEFTNAMRWGIYTVVDLLFQSYSVCSDIDFIGILFSIISFELTYYQN